MTGDYEGLDRTMNDICFGRAEQRKQRERDVRDERARKLDDLKAQVRAGVYKPDIKDIARLLTSALEETV